MIIIIIIISDSNNNNISNNNNDDRAIITIILKQVTSVNLELLDPRTNLDKKSVQEVGSDLFFFLRVKILKKMFHEFTAYFIFLQ